MSASYANKTPVNWTEKCVIPNTFYGCCHKLIHRIWAVFLKRYGWHVCFSYCQHIPLKEKNQHFVSPPFNALNNKGALRHRGISYMQEILHCRFRSVLLDVLTVPKIQNFTSHICYFVIWEKNMRRRCKVLTQRHQ